MDTRLGLLIGLLAASVVGTPAFARTNVDLSINIGPPPAIVEVVPDPRPGYVWAPGYWHWNGHQHAWAKGHWIRERHGYVWMPDQWEQRGDRWYYRRGYWNRG
jgi:WXXGXW repeat (2 copies)